MNNFKINEILCYIYEKHRNCVNQLEDIKDKNSYLAGLFLGEINAYEDISVMIEAKKQPFQD